MVMQEGSGFVCWHKNQSDDAKMYADYVEACTNVRVRVTFQKPEYKFKLIFKFKKSTQKKHMFT
jgi:hypothetical protein